MPSSTSTDGPHPPRRHLVLAGASGGTVDRSRALESLAQLSHIDVIVGDWMSEADMTVRGTLHAYDEPFLAKLAPALPHLARNRIKLACNAGASDPGGLAAAVRALVAEQQLDLTVAWVEGDDVSRVTLDLAARGEPFVNPQTGQPLSAWPFTPHYAQCYLGGGGVLRALQAGADIVLCGRIADSAACVAAAMWWHDWRPDQLDALAGALVAGHCTECSTYVTGGYYSGFKALGGRCADLGFPIAHIEADGAFEVTLEPGRDGEVSVGTVTSQLVYEIQGPLYYNSDVVANLEGIRVAAAGLNRVRVTGVTGAPPPPTTKVGITARGGYRAEVHFLLCGLDIREKAAMIELQTRAAIGSSNLAKLHCLKFQLIGAVATDPASQDEATVDLRIFAQAADPEILAAGAFQTWCKQNILQSCPGVTPHTDPRQGVARPYFEYWISLLPQKFVQHRVHLPDGSVEEIPPPARTQVYPQDQKSSETENPVPLDSWGPTTRAPLGYVVLGRSGDKAADANIGLFVRHDDEWDWLRSLLSSDKFKELLGKDYQGHQIDRFELAGLKAVHFLLKNYLDRGYNATSSLDSLGKNLAEYIRVKRVDIPNLFLERGRI